MVNRVLITGALGHIGSRLIRFLSDHYPDAEFLLVDNLLTQRFCSLFDLKEGRFRFLELDCREVKIQPLVKGCDFVIHLAAMTDAAGSVGRAAEVEKNNFVATEAVANACVEHDVRLIHLSTTSVYGVQDEMVDEDCAIEKLNPQSPYAATKLKEESFLKQMTEDRGLSVVSCRFGTIAGVSPGMRFHTAVNKFCWQAVFGEPLQIWRTAYYQKRPYLELLDACAALKHIMGTGFQSYGLFNVVSENLTVKDIVEEIQSIIPETDVTFVDSPIMNQFSYEVSAKKLLESGFKPEGSISSAIAETIHRLRNANSLGARDV